MIYCAIDIETTGLDPKIHDIIEFAAILDDLRNPRPLTELPVFHSYFKKEYYVGDAFALSMHAEIFRKIANPPEPVISTQKVLEQTMLVTDLPVAFCNWLARNNHPYDEKKKVFTVNVSGKNAAGFDIPFLKAKSNWTPYIHFRHRVVDPGSLYFNPAIDDQLPDSKICMERAGLSGDVKHNAVEDALVVVKLLRNKFCQSEIAPGW
jgi:oligoribonuclease